MYKLTIVAGPNRGSSYAIQNGENSIGRQSGNAVVLSSSKVSKRHCVLVVNQGEVLVQDQGSANGTFVNGVLTQSSKIAPGDHISVGDFILELTDPAARGIQAAPAFGNVIKFPVAAPVSLNLSEGMPAAPAMPRDLVRRAQWMFEHQVMPIFYGMNFKNQWKVISVGAFGIFLLASLFLTTFPILNETKDSVAKEASKRATFMAKQIADRNAPILAARQESKAEIGSAETADGVRVAVLTDMDNRVIAPASKSDAFLASGGEGVLLVKARDLFRKGRETGIVSRMDDQTVAAIEPVKVASTVAGKNVVVGMAIVSIDTSLSTPSFGEDGLVYSETLIITGILGAILLLILYRLTMKPLEVLGDDLDKALKGDLSQVTREFKFEELTPLYDLINSTLQRLPRGGSSSPQAAPEPSVDEYLGPLRMLGETLKGGVVVFDHQRRIVYLNGIFEEISGIRADSASGQYLGSVARDQSLGSFANDLMDRLIVGSEGLAEDYEFSGITYRVKISAFGSSTLTSQCYLMIAVRSES